MLIFNTYNTLNLKENIITALKGLSLDTSLSSLSLQMFRKFNSILEGGCLATREKWPNLPYLVH